MSREKETKTVSLSIKKMPEDVHKDLIVLQAYYTLQGEPMNLEQVIFKCIKQMNINVKTEHNLK